MNDIIISSTILLKTRVIHKSYCETTRVSSIPILIQYPYSARSHLQHNSNMTIRRGIIIPQTRHICRISCFECCHYKRRLRYHVLMDWLICSPISGPTRIGEMLDSGNALFTTILHDRNQWHTPIGTIFIIGINVVHIYSIIHKYTHIFLMSSDIVPTICVHSRQIKQRIPKTRIHGHGNICISNNRTTEKRSTGVFERVSHFCNFQKRKVDHISPYRIIRRHRYCMKKIYNVKYLFDL